MPDPEHLSAREVRYLLRHRAETPWFNECWFLTKMPAELRVLIFRILFEGQELGLIRGPEKGNKKVRDVALYDVAGYLNDNRPTHDSVPSHRILAIAQVCKQLRQEALVVLQESSSLVMTAASAHSLRDGEAPFWTGIQDVRLEEISDLSIVPSLFPSLPLAFTNLKTLSLLVTPTSFCYVKKIPGGISPKRFDVAEFIRCSQQGWLRPDEPLAQSRGILDKIMRSTTAYQALIPSVSSIKVFIGETLLSSEVR